MSWLTLNWFDYLIIVIVLFSILVSFFRGLLRELISLLAWILALVLALKFSQILGSDIPEHIGSPMLRYFVAFVFIFIAVLVVGMIINAIVRFLIEKSGMGFFDRFLGVIFGAIRGLLLVSIILLFINVSDLRAEPWVTQSRIAPHFQPVVDWLETFLPQEIKQVSAWISQDREQVAVSE